jgi:hypothetical protein
MSLILGLDVSTSITGVCFVDSNVEPDDKGSHIVTLDHVNFKKCNGIFEKADKMKSEMIKYVSSLGRAPDVLALEEPLLGFSKGMSSAATITTLMRFNGIVSYIGRDVFGVEPVYVSAARARKLCGIKLQKTSVAGMSQKEQVFKHMSEHDLRHVTWDVKKRGAPIDASRDMTDAYVIARAACLMNK